MPESPRRSSSEPVQCLNKSFNFCGLKLGWTFIIGIVPGAGNVACAALMICKAREADLPPWLLGRMLFKFNNAMSTCSGIIPVVGDITVAAYKANSRDVTLLGEFLRVKGDHIADGKRGRGKERSGHHERCLAEGHGIDEARHRNDRARAEL